MATAEQLLHEAQYAFHNISFGESRDNRRNRRRASSFARKIIRKYPTSPEVAEAHAILRRLGEEAFTSKMPVVHQHSTRHTIPQKSAGAPEPVTDAGDETVPLDWHGLWSVLSRGPKTLWGVAAIIAAIFYELFGVFILLPLIALFLFTGPFRGILQPRQRREINQFVIQANAWIDERLRNNA